MMKEEGAVQRGRCSSQLLAVKGKLLALRQGEVPVINFEAIFRALGVINQYTNAQNFSMKDMLFKLL